MNRTESAKRRLGHASSVKTPFLFLLFNILLNILINILLHMLLHITYMVSDGRRRCNGIHNKFIDVSNRIATRAVLFIVYAFGIRPTSCVRSSVCVRVRVRAIRAIRAIRSICAIRAILTRYSGDTA